MPYGRFEKRFPAQVLVQLSSPNRQVLAEPAYTENISANGTRILTRRQWSRDEHLQIECSRWDFRSTARVAYCQSVPGNQFAVGLEFLNPPAPPVQTQDDSPWPPLRR